MGGWDGVRGEWDVILGSKGVDGTTGVVDGDKGSGVLASGDCMDGGLGVGDFGDGELDLGDWVHEGIFKGG